MLKRSDKGEFKCHSWKKTKDCSYNISIAIIISISIISCILAAINTQHHSVVGGILYCWIPCVGEYMHTAIKVDAIKAVVDGIGLSSIVITYVFAERNSRELSISYLSLAYQVQPQYKCLVILHYTSVLTCLWTTRMGDLEVSLFLLIIILVGCIRMYRVVELLILSPDRRQEIAIKMLKKQVKENEIEKNVEIEDAVEIERSITQQLRNVHLIIDQIEKVDAEGRRKLYQILLGLWMSLNERIIHANMAMKTEDELSILQFAARTSANMWARILRGSQPEDKTIIVNELIVEASKNEGQNGQSCGIIYAGYVLWLYEWIIENGTKDGTEVLKKLRENIDSCIEHLEGTMDSAKRSIYQIAVAIHWMYFFSGRCMHMSVMEMPGKYQVGGDSKNDSLVKAVLMWCTEAGYKEYIDYIATELRPNVNAGGDTKVGDKGKNAEMCL